MRKVSIAIIGFGAWGFNLVREFNNLNILTHICEINEERIQKCQLLYPNIKITKNWNELIENENITAICISLPADLHYRYTKEALLNNKDVFVEKPITLNLEEANELIKISEEKNRILMVGHVLQYHPCIEKIKELLKNNKIGKIRNIISNRLNLGTFRTQENVLWSFAPHDISLILSLCNDKLPDYITCMGKDNITKGIHDITNTILEWENENIYVNINVNWLNPYKEQKLTIIGEKGMIIFDDTLIENKLKLFEEYLKYSNTLPATPCPIKTAGINIAYDNNETALYRECKHFYNCCLSRLEPITSGTEGLRVLKILHYSSQSLSLNKRINLNQEKKQSDYFSHSTAIIEEGAKIGQNCKIWAFSHITKDAIIGENTSIGEHCYIAGILGKNCKVQNGVNIYKGINAGNFTFWGSGVQSTNDLNPKAKYSKNGNYIETFIEDEVTFGAGSIIRCGIKLGKGCFVGCGAVVVNDVPQYKIVVGNPAKVIGEIDEYGNRKII